jgi:hypothetical protein
MSTSKHTPGPWIASEFDAEGHFTITNETRSTAICYGAGFYGDNDPSQANARLIASAPVLVEALQKLRDAAMNTPALDSSQDWTDLIVLADAVLKDAQIKS